MRIQDIYGVNGDHHGHLLGGPWDNQAIAFSRMPERIVLDGHVYTGSQGVVPEGYINAGEPMDVTYRYQGKDVRSGA